MNVAIVTGGTSGIGLATARVLVEAGARVMLAGRDPEKGALAVATLGPNSAYTADDVSRESEVAALVAETVGRWGRLDWAVNAAALADLRPARIAEIAAAEWDRTVAVDLKGIWLCMKHQLPALQEAGGGAIVNVSSVNGLSGTPTAAAYCAAKHGIIGLSKTAALKYAPDRFRVNVVCPGAHRTPMLERVFDVMSPAAPEQAEAMYSARIAAGRIGDPDECARAIAWLLSDAAPYVTGAVLSVDGGLSAGS